MSRKPHSRKGSQPARPFRSIASQLTADDLIAVEETDAAELRGDWSTAFDRHRSVSMFTESGHGADLEVLDRLCDDAPDWLVARFLVGMAHRLESFGQPRRSGRVLQAIVPLLYPHGIPLDVIGCRHPEQVGPRIFGMDWVVRQADAYDLGGLEDLLNDPAAMGAIGTAPIVEAWVDQPMGGWRIVGTDGDVVTVADADSGAEVGLLDLGVTAQLEVGSHVLGRVVPTAAEPGWLFDWRPLPVSARLARAVAGQPHEWLDILASRALSGALAPGFSHLTDTGIAADLPRHAWGALVGHPVDRIGRHPAALAQDALEAALDLAADPGAVRRQRHLVAQLLLDEVVDPTVLGRCAFGRRRAAWHALAAVVPAHAAGRRAEALALIEAEAV